MKEKPQPQQLQPFVKSGADLPCFKIALKKRKGKIRPMNFEILSHPYLQKGRRDLATVDSKPFVVRLKDQSLTQMVANHVRQRSMKKQSKAPPLHVTQKWVVKENELVLALVDMADRAGSSSIPPRCRTQSQTRAQARQTMTPVRLKNLNDILVESDSSGDDVTPRTSRACRVRRPA